MSTRNGGLVNDGDEMVVLPSSPTSSVPGGDTCVTRSNLERRVSTMSSYAPPTTRRSRTCSVLSTSAAGGGGGGCYRDLSVADVIAGCAATLAANQVVAAASATKEVAVYRVMMLGGPGVGKTALTQQFVTSEYIAAQNTSFDDGITIPVPILLEGEESVVEFIDLPYNGELNTWRDYDVDGYVIVYSITDRRSYQKAVDLLYAIKANVANTKPIILAANKSDLERSRVIGKQEGRTVAETYECKYIDVSAILNHRVDELLVGVLKQVRLRRENARKASTAETGATATAAAAPSSPSATDTPPRSPFRRRRGASSTRRARDDSGSVADMSCFSSSTLPSPFYGVIDTGYG